MNKKQEAKKIEKLLKMQAYFDSLFYKWEGVDLGNSYKVPIKRTDTELLLILGSMIKLLAEIICSD